jgi:gas vesicle protein
MLSQSHFNFISYYEFDTQIRVDKEGDYMARKKKNNPILPLLVGGVIGGAAALVMAPASGKETRENIVSGTNRLLYKANDQKNNLIRETQKFADSILRKAESIYNKSAAFAGGTYTYSADSIELQIRSFKNAIDAAVEAYKNTRTVKRESQFANEVIVNEMFTDFEDETLPKNEGMGRRQE